MEFIVEGMTCDHCARAITKALYALDASVRVEVDVAAGTVAIDGGMDAALAAAAIEAEGYRVVSAQDAPKGCCGGCKA